MQQSKNPYTVVVGVDYSETSSMALFEAFLTASRYPDGEVHVVHVETAVHVVSFGEQVERSMAQPPLGPAFQRLLDFTSHELERFNAGQRRREGKTLARVTAHVRRDAPAEEIAQLAVDLDADLIIIGARGTTAIQRLALGSVAHAVVALALCPVFVARFKESPLNVPDVQPPCPRCVEVRSTSFGCDVWCDEHRAQHGQRRNYQRAGRPRRTTSSIFRN